MSTEQIRARHERREAERIAARHPKAFPVTGRGRRASSRAASAAPSSG